MSDYERGITGLVIEGFEGGTDNCMLKTAVPNCGVFMIYPKTSVYLLKCLSGLEIENTMLVENKIGNDLLVLYLRDDEDNIMEIELEAAYFCIG